MTLCLLQKGGVLPTSERQALLLVVDDTEATRYAVTRTLSREGYRIVQAATGFEGLKKVDELRPDLVILDIHLPDINGFEVCRRIKSDPEFATTPVLQISASYVTERDKIHGLEGGADNYLTHPVEPPVLVATVKSLLRFRRMNERLRENEERLSLALSVAEIGMWDFDLASRQVMLSERTCRILGLETTVAPRALLRRFEAQSRKKLLEALREARRHPDLPVEIEARLNDSTIQERWIRVKAILTRRGGRAGQREPSQFSGTVLEVTAQKTAQREIHTAREIAEQARETAESANRAKSQFLANVSHEIRTPLGVIMGFSDLLLEEAKLADEPQEYVTTIRRNAENLAELIEEVLDISKIEANRMAIETIRFSLLDVVRDTISTLDLKAREKSLILRSVFEGPVPASIQGDPTRLRQILVNLIGNAIKFTERGSVEVRVRLLHPPRPGEPLSFEINVIDTGIGINPDKSPRLFQPFMQADSSMTRRFGGTGLGLMLSRQLAQLMGGDLVLQKSNPGEGSVFTLRLPGGAFQGDLISAGGASGTKAAQTVSHFARLPELKILLVEDSVDNQFMIRKFLGSLGAQVETANNGEEALSLVAARSYDVVLMDLQMPVMDGYEATRRLRAQGFREPIIALTAHALKGERERCMELGFSDYLTKPLQREALHGKLSALPKAHKL